MDSPSRFEDFPQRPQVFCPNCDMALFYLKVGSAAYIICHPETSCKRSGHAYKIPNIVLERIL